MAGTSIGSTALYLSADASELARGLEAAAKLYKQFGDKTRAEAKKQKEDWGLVGKVLGVAGGVFTGLAAFTGITELGSALTDVVSDAVKLAASAEAASADFAILYGDAEKAKDVFAEIREISTKTPFGTEELTAAAKTLLSVGVAGDQLVPTIQKLGDLAGVSGERLQELARQYARVRDEGQVTHRTFREFFAAGVPIVAPLAQVLGKTQAEVRTLADEGKIGFSDLQRAIDLATSEGGKFFGRTEAGSKTLSGELKILKNNWEELLVGLGEIIIDEFGLKDVVAKLTETTQSARDNLDSIRPIIREIADFAKRIGKSLYEGAFSFAVQIAAVIDDVRSLIDDANELAGRPPLPATGTKKFDKDDIVRPRGSIRSDAADVLFGGAPKKETAESAVLALKVRLDKVWDGGGVSFADAATASFVHSLNPLGAGFGREAGKGFVIEADKLTKQMLDRVKGLREEFDPLEKVKGELDDLRTIRKRGGFLQKGVGALGLGDVGQANDLFAFAVGKLLKELTDKFPALDSKTGIATQGSAESAGAIIDAMNRSTIKPEDKVVAAINAQKAIQQAHLAATKRIIDILQKAKIIPAF